MFTGIVEEVGTVRGIKKGEHSAQIAIEGKVIFSDLHVGNSVAVNGVCLTVTQFDENLFTADVMHETLHRSSLGMLKNGSHVNLERAMLANGRFGGHIVSGHIDATGQIAMIKRDDNAIWYTLEADREILKYIVAKGSVAIDGISLTVAVALENSFSVSIIPHTVKATTLCEKRVGDVVNLENDIVGKYVEKLLCTADVGKKESNITREFLMEFGY